MKQVTGMYQYSKENSVKVMGFIIMGLYLVMVGFTRINDQHSIFEGNPSCTVPAFIMGIILVIAALYLIYCSNILVGMVFMLTGFAAICLGMSDISGYNDSFRAVVAIGSLILMFMALRLKDLDLLILNGLNMFVYVIAMNSLSNLIPSDLVAFMLLVIGFFAIYIALKAWTPVQDETW